LPRAAGGGYYPPEMVFSTPFFLTFFLPLALVLCWAAGAAGHGLPAARRWGPANAALFAASLLFYFWGEGWGVGWLAASVVFNHAAARTLSALRRRAAKRAVLAAAVTGNLAVLGWFKYAGFAARSLDLLPGVSLPVPDVALPLGISFYTFQALAYVVDVYRGGAAPARSFLDFGCYLTMFPQLVAGPIVRWADVAGRVRERDIGLSRVASGLRRFLVGLAKKALVANTVADLADAAWAQAGAGHAIPTSLAWLALLCYSLQIYYDFSGYSDMAIGIGRMLGFDFPENFLHPYASRSVREFWRRWHVSLSTWFRDYLYIPLGGSRCGAARACFNGLVVFALCGLWHGASAVFLLWGLWHGAFLTVERLASARRRGKSAPPADNGGVFRAIAAHAYVVFVFGAGWLLFRSEGAADFRTMLLSLAGAGAPAPETALLWLHVHPKLLLAVACGTVFSLPVLPLLRHRLARLLPAGACWTLESAAAAALGYVSLAFLVGGTYNPFLYFRF
jgi:alginate O-acetyltransferase complex protein AlgI